MMTKMKINLHITQKCNYSCKYCFAHFADSDDLVAEDWKKIIDNVAASGLIDAVNFAGGEPVLYKGFSELLRYAYGKGLAVSVISNGSLLLNERLMNPEDFALLETLGISVDSFDTETLRALGCCDCRQKVLELADFVKLAKSARLHNPAIKLKTNTVVSRLNWQEKVTGLADELGVDRWKYLRIKYFCDGRYSNEALLISDEEYDCFLAANGILGGRAVVERDLSGSYIMVDNKGNLVDDYGEKYLTVGNLLEEPFGEVFSRYNFAADKYQSRYT